jgi:hypothetical protein
VATVSNKDEAQGYVQNGRKNWGETLLPLLVGKDKDIMEVPVPQILVPVLLFWFRHFGSVFFPPSDRSRWTIIKNVNHRKTCKIKL